jgi:hypothetical protein
VYGSKLDKKKIINRELSENLIQKCHAILKPVMLRRIKADGTFWNWHSRSGCSSKTL